MPVCRVSCGLSHRRLVGVTVKPGAAAPRVCCKGRWGPRLCPVCKFYAAATLLQSPDPHAVTAPSVTLGVSVRFACPPGKFAVKP